MKKASEGTPREGDLPRLELIALADEQVKDGATVYFKFTCAHCGERCTFTEDPNVLWPSGECFACGKETEVDVGGFMLTRLMNGKDAIDYLKNIAENADD